MRDHTLSHAPLHHGLVLLLFAAGLTVASPASAQEETEPDGEIIKIGVLGGFPELLGISTAVTPSYFQLEVAASVPIRSMDYQNVVGRFGVRPSIWTSYGEGTIVELRLPLMLGTRYQYNGPDLQPSCEIGWCNGPQKEQWFVNAYAGIEASIEMKSGFELFAELGGGYNHLTNEGVDTGQASHIGEARLMVGTMF
ncbi:MAG: hypothetical protein ACQEVA_05980 [Myxococcota bacterium]